jgi:CheY-like chemotaxis protein
LVAVTGSSVPAQLPRGSESILLVEDDESVRRLARLILERSGYRIVEAENPSQAFRLAGEFGGAIDLLLSDVIMPEIRRATIVPTAGAAPTASARALHVQIRG